MASADFKEEKPTAGFRGRGAATGLAENKRIVRLATGEERMRLPIKQLEEERAMMVCREKVQQRRLPMVIVDAEYQYDRHKLTFYFEADRRIDFRELVADLFALYKTRIWMQQIDDSFKPNPLLSAALARGTADPNAEVILPSAGTTSLATPATVSTSDYDQLASELGRSFSLW